MKVLVRKIIVRFSFLPVFLGLLILVPAGTFNYWSAYVYITVLVTPMLFVLFYFLRVDPQFLERRARAKEKEQQQVVIQVVFSLIFLSAYIVSGLDRRFGWSAVPLHIVLTADAVIV